ncbi:hypothetical protein [Nostoc sp.]
MKHQARQWQLTQPQPNKALYPTAYSFARSSLCFRRRVRLVVGWSLRGDDRTRRIRRLCVNPISVLAIAVLNGVFRILEFYPDLLSRY